MFQNKNQQRTSTLKQQPPLLSTDTPKLELFNLPPPPPPSGTPLGKKISSSSASINNSFGAATIITTTADYGQRKEPFLIRDGFGDIELDSRYYSKLKNSNSNELSSSNGEQLHKDYALMSSPTSSDIAVEWTPEDSSYGAAIPICGWIPKNIRRTIEFCLFAIILASFIVGIVKLIAPLTLFRSSSTSNTNDATSISTSNDFATTNTSYYYNDDNGEGN